MTTKTHSDSSDRAGEIVAAALYGLFRGIMIFWPALLALALLAWGWSLDSWLDWAKCFAAGGVAYVLWPTQKRLVTRSRMESKVRRLLAGQAPWAAETPAVRARHGEASGTWRVTVATPHGSTDEAVANLAAVIESRLGAHLVAAVPTGAAECSGAVVFDVSMTDRVLSSTIDESMLSVRPTGLVNRHDGWKLPLGVTAMGRTRMVTLWHPAQGSNRLLVVGNSGTGKSSCTLRILSSAIANDLRTFVFDPAASSVRGWSQQVTKFASTPAEMLDLIEDVMEEFERREALIAAGQADQIRPGLVLIEEVGALLGDSAFARGGALQKRKTELEAFLTTMALKARKTGLTLVLSLQDSAGESLGGTAVRSQFNITVGFPLAEAKARLALSEHGARICSSLGSLPPGIAVLEDESSSSEDSRAHVIRFPAIVAPPVEKEEEPDTSAAQWTPWEERERRAQTVVEEAEEIVRSSRRKDSKIKTNKKGGNR